ncbi:ABC transporter ATP-binding protein [Desulfoferrobacter suflitae]|uniref:ABC transporter ATP-binding protein n=1 Tax=Desulfoferrobacter suflitae TaxID=2865782 RepID=UPI002164360F|nr:ABC transporter ATP-binding protein [Desulfoferrobacter suflitae]MCK8602808.1 ABC transporter ATP-binding protein [Desulfoferrobacter suflitae]
MALPVLHVKDLKTQFFTERGVVKAVDAVSLKLMKSLTLGVVGESGCGKSVTALSIMRLIQPPGRIVEGEIWFDGRDLLTLSEEAMRSIRGKEISMIFQEPMTSLNPVFRVGDQIIEILQRHETMSNKEASARTAELLKQVGIPSPRERMADYPHQMSGGMRQRVMIAMAVACSPQVIIADEPTTALDVTIQAQILDLLRKLKEETGTTVLLITHDLGVIAEVAEDVVVMYAGRAVEQARCKDIFRNPLHPYTQGLMQSIPGRTAHTGKRRLTAIPGVVPSLLELPAGCKFNTRCPHAFERCYTDPEPGLLEPDLGHPVRCWLYA